MLQNCTFTTKIFMKMLLYVFLYNPMFLMKEQVVYSLFFSNKQPVRNLFTSSCIVDTEEFRTAGNQYTNSLWHISRIFFLIQVSTNHSLCYAVLHAHGQKLSFVAHSLWNGPVLKCDRYIWMILYMNLCNGMHRNQIWGKWVRWWW